jgi:hypothetical protein
MTENIGTEWHVDLETATASRADGWKFRFSPVPGEPGVFGGECIGMPSPFTSSHVAQAARIAREAGDAYVAARNARH